MKKQMILVLILSASLVFYVFGCTKKKSETEQQSSEIQSDSVKSKMKKIKLVPKDGTKLTMKKTMLVGNSLCPVSGKAVAGDPKEPTFHSDFEGYRIGFMCPVCKGKFDSADENGKKEMLKTALKSVGKNLPTEPEPPAAEKAENPKEG